MLYLHMKSKKDTRVVQLYNNFNDYIQFSFSEIIIQRYIASYKRIAEISVFGDILSFLTIVSVS